MPLHQKAVIIWVGMTLLVPTLCQLPEEDPAIEDCDTETESEEEEELVSGSVLRDGEVFLGPISSEEIRVNKRIGGRRTTLIARPSVLPGQLEEDCDDSPLDQESPSPDASVSDQENEQMILSRSAVTIQQFLRTHSAIRTLKALKSAHTRKVAREQHLQCVRDLLVQIMIPSMYQKATHLRRTSQKEASISILEGLLPRWQQSQRDAQLAHISEQRAKEKLR